MAITVVKTAKESSDRLIARFNKKVQASRILLEVRAKRYFKRPLRKREERAMAKMRQHYRSLKDKMKFY